MDDKKRLMTENIVLLIIAVTLLSVKLSDTLMVSGKDFAGTRTDSQDVKPYNATSESPQVTTDIKSDSKKQPQGNKKTAFTFTLQDLNRFSVEEMVQLDGVGPVLAGRIVAYRKAHGKIERITELKGIKGIGTKKYAAIMKQYR